MEQESVGDRSRRRVLQEGGGILAAAGLLRLVPGAPQAVAATVPAGRDAVEGTAAEGSVTVRESANLGVTAAPDGRSLAMDVAGGIWVLPAAGGQARRITPLSHDATRPHWSPDGARIAFQSFRDGVYQVWSLRPDGTDLTQHTSGPGYDLEPRWSPDGRRIAFASDRGNRSRIWVLDLDGGALHAVTEDDTVHAAPAWSPDGTRLAYVVDGTVIEAVDLRTMKRSRLAAASGEAQLYSPVYTPGGETVSYVQVDGGEAVLKVGERTVVSGEDLPPLPVSFTSATTFFYSAGGRLHRGTPGGPSHEVPFTAELPIAARAYRRTPRDLTSDAPRRAKGIASPVLSRDGRQIAFRALNALWVLPTGGRPRKVLDDGYFSTDPDFMPDGRSLVYVSDRAGSANLWRLDLASGHTQRLTDLPDGQLTPRVSPDGTRIAYQDESGALWVLDVAKGAARKVLPSLYQPGRPAWSPDGTKLALSALRPYSRRTETGHNQVLTVDLATGTLRYQAIAPDRSLSTRGDDGPLWTPDGKHLVFGAESLAWRAPVDPDGTLTGPPVPLTSEVTDSLSLGGDGRLLLYLSNGVLRTVGIGGGAARTVPVDLTYRPARVSEPVVVRAGALWDGSSEKLRAAMDIVVRDGRIAAVTPRSTGAARGARLVDVSHLTVMPGLIDTHNHWNMRGKQWGDRQGRLWLAYGVTTSRSPGDPAYQMAENREAMEAGTRIGPRYLGSGEALDGTRASYNCMRTTMSAEQLERELDRAAGLDYDLLKSYMRLSPSHEQRVVRRAHSLGVPVTSHYLYPAAHTGLDGMEHPGGGHRLGYSRTLSFVGVHMSQDAVDLLVASGMWVSSTTIFAAELFVGDRSLIDDERTKVLYPDWEYRRLVEKADGAGHPGPETDLNRRLTKGMVDALLRVQRAGGLVVCGTDAPLDDIGISIHQNLRALVKYGFTPRQALLTATGNAARALGYGDLLGAVAPGRIADLVAVEGDPLTDIGAAAAVRTVMVGGVTHTVPEILAPFRQSALRAAGRSDAVSVRPAAPSAAHDPRHYWHQPEWSRKGCCRP
ncbi:amidohydrolase family protein [Streptomyces sp. NPDC090442]|uniref:amidohydrolase family protein n=1 Tax=Streptomyces sp. NPDC090442 TaxID=3365962 RepID=UPI00382B5D4D